MISSRSPIVELGVRAASPLALVVAAFLFFAGHNRPGGGFAAGLVLGHLAVAAASPILLERYGVVIEMGFGSLELQVLAALVGVGLVAGLLPAWRGLRTPVAENLHPTD